MHNLQKAYGLPEVHTPYPSPLLEALLPDCGKDATAVSQPDNGIPHRNLLFSQGIEWSAREYIFWHLHCVEGYWLDGINDLHAESMKDRRQASKPEHQKASRQNYRPDEDKRREELAGPPSTR